MITDARALYDPLHRRSCHGSLRSCSQGDCFWIPGLYMISDCFTKRVGNSSLMRKVMYKGRYALQPSP